MTIPKNTTVLVVGGGPAGSYCASVLAREGHDTVVLEADKFPRYHIGESMLPSIRHFFRFIDLDKTFDDYGFRPKKGATFKLNKSMPEVYTDFIAAGGPKGYAWNVVRSEADHLMFKHAQKSGAKTFDGVRVTSLEFQESGLSPNTELQCEIPDPGRPVSATWSRKEDGSSGTINFKYLVDASGKAGMMCTTYLENRKFNEGGQLKNVAVWGYWEGGGEYGIGTVREGSPYFEALQDASGWIWYIPLHNDQVSVGVVMNLAVSTSKKREQGIGSKELYLNEIRQTPGIQALLEKATFVSDIRSASDWSYSAPAYASPYVRIAGDAACFIDPFFSSGVHLALAASLSAAVTISASIKEHCSEMDAAVWHSKKVAEGYTRFLLVVSSALKQIKAQDEPVLSDFDEKTFERAFSHFRPIIQGQVDVPGKLSQTEVSKTVDFCFQAFAPLPLSEKEAVMEKMSSLGISDPATSDEKYDKGVKELQSFMSPEQIRIMHTIRARQMLRSEDTLNIENFGTDIINGLTPRLVKGELGLVKPSKAPTAQPDVLALMSGEEKPNGFYENGKAPINGAHSNGVSTTNGLSQNQNDTELHFTPLKGTSQDGSEASRLKIQDSLHNIAEEMETPHDTMLRLLNSGLEITTVTAAMDLDIFRRLSEAPKPLSVDELAAPSNADPMFLGRLLRYLASRRFITETGLDHFTANHASRAFSDPRIEGGVKYTFRIGGQTYLALPAFLKEHNYANNLKGKFPWHKGANTDLDFFPWAQQHPEILKWFQQLMSVPREGNWLDVMAMPSGNDNSGTPVFVDVGGGFGQQCASVTARYPNLKGRVVLQDREETIQMAPPIEGVKAMAHNFFTPQIIKGSKFYYLRTVLHDWSDEEVTQILKNLIPAMASDSKILIDEIVLPDTGVHWWSACMDLNMYAMLGAMERSERHWRALLDHSGLRLAELKIYSPVMRHAIIVAEPKV